MLAPRSTGLAGQFWLTFPDREISTRRAQTWQKILRDLRFARAWSRAAVRATRETTPTCIGRFKAFRCLRSAAPSAFLGSTVQIVRFRRK